MGEAAAPFKAALGGSPDGIAVRLEEEGAPVR
jgi:hypothetical protein